MTVDRSLRDDNQINTSGARRSYLFAHLFVEGSVLVGVLDVCWGVAIVERYHIHVCVAVLFTVVWFFVHILLCHHRPLVFGGWVSAGKSGREMSNRLFSLMCKTQLFNDYLASLVL